MIRQYWKFNESFLERTHEGYPQLQQQQSNSRCICVCVYMCICVYVYVCICWFIKAHGNAVGSSSCFSCAPFLHGCSLCASVYMYICICMGVKAHASTNAVRICIHVYFSMHIYFIIMFHNHASLPWLMFACKWMALNHTSSSLKTAIPVSPWWSPFSLVSTTHPVVCPVMLQCQQTCISQRQQGKICCSVSWHHKMTLIVSWLLVRSHVCQHTSLKG